MIRVNLLPEEFRQPEVKKFKLPEFVGPKGLLVFLGLLVCIELALLAYLKFVAEPQYVNYQSKYLQLGPNLKGVRDIKSQAAKAQDVNRQLLSWINAGHSWSSLLDGISSGMEKGVWLTLLTFERRDFDVPLKVEERAQPALNPAATAAVADIQSKVKGMGKKTKESAKERRVVMVIQGRVAAEDNQAAVTGRLIESMKNQSPVSDLIEDLRLDEIRRADESQSGIFDFVISGVVRREKEKEFFNLP
jgi:hypothetical protein